MQNTLTFYRTPSEISPTEVGDRVRVAGNVVAGSLQRVDDTLSFRVTDGTRDIQVEQRIELPGAVREGQQIVVEGVLDGRGVLHADTVMAKHGNTYEPSTGADQSGPGQVP
jgi:cytochrome c-type biogenesis protein CcmE